MLQRLPGFFLRLFIALFIGAAAIVAAQDFLVLPSLSRSLFLTKGTRLTGTPEGVESIFLKTDDNVAVEVWRVGADTSSPEAPRTAILFHGNGDFLSSSLGVQRWLARMGFTTYALEYRGVGLSEGWPSEEAIYSDAHALWNLMKDREKATPESLLIAGVSLGTGPASYLATNVYPRALLLVSPYTSLPDVAAESPLYRPLKKLLKYRFPVKDHLLPLRETCVVVAHGDWDSVIPVSHSRQLHAIYQSREKYTFLFDAEATHGDILARQEQQVHTALKECFVTAKNS